MKSYFFYIITLVFIVSCGSAKNKSESKGNKESIGFNASEFPYIESFHSGVRLKEQKKYDQALAAFNKCLTIKQTDDAVYFAIGELYKIKNDPAKAIENFKKASDLDKGNRYYIEELANLYYEQKNYTAAADNFGKLTKLDPKNIEWLYGYAESLLGAGQSLEAIKALDKMESELGPDPQLTIQKYQIYMSLKQTEKAVAELQKGRKALPDDQNILGTLVDHYFQNNQTDKGIELLKELVKTDPNNGRANLILGQFALEQKRNAEATQYFIKAFGSNQVDFQTKSQIAVFYLDNYTNGDTQTEQVINSLVSAHPENALSYSILADFYVTTNENIKALETYKKANNIDKSEFSVWSQIFLLQIELQDYTDLFESSSEALEYFPNLPQIYYYNSLAANQLRKFDTALSSALLGAELVINDPFLKAELYAQSGEAYFGLKDYVPGKSAFEDALKISPENITVKNNYAYQLAIANKDLNAAKALINDYVNSADAPAYIIDTYGLILFQEKNYEESYSYLKQANTKDQNDFTILEHLGDAAVKLGKTTEALDYWKKAKTLGSKNKKLDLKIEKKQYYDPEY